LWRWGEGRLKKRRTNVFFYCDRKKKKWMEEVRFKTRNERRNERRRKKEFSIFFLISYRPTIIFRAVTILTFLFPSQNMNYLHMSTTESKVRASMWTCSYRMVLKRVAKRLGR